MENAKLPMVLRREIQTNQEKFHEQNFTSGGFVTVCVHQKIATNDAATKPLIVTFVLRHGDRFVKSQDFHFYKANRRIFWENPTISKTDLFLKSQDF